MTPPRQFLVPDTAAGLRLDQYLAGLLADRGYSRERVKKIILGGEALVDGKPASPKLRLAGGETLELRLNGAEPCELVPEAGGLSLLFRDAHLLALNKPAGLTVHPAPSQPQGTLVHRLLHHFPELASMEGLRPGIVHRIDKDTSGILAVALDESTRLALSRTFADRRVDKRYLAVVLGKPPFGPDGALRINLPLGRHPTIKTRMAVLPKGGRPALTVCKPLWSDPEGTTTLLEVAIHTGRTHQIRVHLSHAGHPLLGDRLYGGRAPTPVGKPLLPKLVKRQMLHAWKLGLEHPVTGEQLRMACPPPKDMLRPLLYLGRRLQRVAVTGLPGCGKSSLARFLGELGAPVFNADAVVGELYEPRADGWELLKRRYGERFVVGENESVDKKALFAAMRTDERLRREVMDLIHPLVRHRMKIFHEQHANERLAIAEIPLLFESGWNQDICDLAVCVHAPAALRLERLLDRGLTSEAAAALDSWQWPERDKRNAAQIIVENTGDLEELKFRSQELWRALRDIRRSQAVELWNSLHQLTGGSLFPSTV